MRGWDRRVKTSTINHKRRKDASLHRTHSMHNTGTGVDSATYGLKGAKVHTSGPWTKIPGLHNIKPQAKYTCGI